MILSKNIIENNGLFLKNLNLNATLNKDVWTSGLSNIEYYDFNLDESLMITHLYYVRCQYKYSTTSETISKLKLYKQKAWADINGVGTEIDNPSTNTEYTVYGLCNGPWLFARYETYLDNIQLRWGVSSGITSYIKNPLVYDVTDLYTKLKATGVVSDTNTLVTWCNNNLQYVKCGTDYDISSLISDLTSIKMSNGTLLSEVIECDGMQAYSSSSTYRDTYFDSGNGGLSIYNNKGNGTVTHSRIAATSDSPFYPEHKYMLKITTNGTATPSAGGFTVNHPSSANKKFIQRFVAKIPVGYNVVMATNAQGTGSKYDWLTPVRGTGKFEEYAGLWTCGSSGTFSTGGFMYLNVNGENSSATNTSVTWYIAYHNHCDITDKPELAYYTALPNKVNFKGIYTFTNKFDTMNLIPNGDGSDTNQPLPSGWSWDTSDVAGNAKASIVQAVNASADAHTNTFGFIKINPIKRYKISCWVKCKQDMTSYLFGLKYYYNDILLNHNNVIYLPGTLTQLKADLPVGATQMTVSSNANWEVRGYSGVGARSNYYSYSYDNLGRYNTTAGLISGVSGSNIVKFSTPYQGTALTAGCYVCEGLDGGTYLYPIMKTNLPTDNTWKYIETYFGAEQVWDGASANGWIGIPFNCNQMKLFLNYYTNNGTVPIKFSDIRIEEVGSWGDSFLDNTIRIKTYSNL